MGFAGKSGASATALGSVRQYGLVEGVGDGTRISQLGLRILEPVSSQERSDAIFEASRKPDAFRAVLNRFDGKVPAADEPVRAFLIRELGFSKNGAEDCLGSLRETLEMIGEPHSDSMSQSIPASQSTLVVAESQTRESPTGETMRIPLTKDCSVELRFTGPVSEKAIANLIRHIELMKEIWGG